MFLSKSWGLMQLNLDTASLRINIEVSNVAFILQFFHCFHKSQRGDITLIFWIYLQQVPRYCYSSWQLSYRHSLEFLDSACPPQPTPWHSVLWLFCLSFSLLLFHITDQLGLPHFFAFSLHHPLPGVSPWTAHRLTQQERIFSGKK